MKFYDTSALLDLPPDTLLAEPFLIADITLYELEDIKTSGKKDEATKAKARTVTRLLAEHPAAYTVVSIDYHQLFSILNDVPVKDNNDGTIMAAARWYLNELIEKKEDAEKIQTRTGVFEKSAADELVAKTTADVDSFCFVTSDLSCFNLAQRVMKLPCELSLDSCGAHNDYTGWTEVALEDSGEEALAMAYSKDVEQKNLFDTPTNGYVLIPNADADGNTAGLRWDGSHYVPIKYKNLNTAYSGKIKPLNNQQKLAFDLLQNDDITIKLLLGVYGSGKDFLMVNHAVDLIEKGKYDKIVWVRNNIEVKDTKEIGFLPGSMLEKVYPFAANLADCLGGEVALERAITDGWVEIQPLGFIRGRSFNRSIIYCSEAENLTKQHIQLLIGRVGEGSTLWINGDLRQIDDVAFERNNGIQKLIDKLAGNERFGTVYFPITERSETARLADMLD
jgi:predicted ribonuclease YlaK